MTETVVEKIPGTDLRIVDQGTPEPPPTGDCQCDIRTRNTQTLSPGSEATAELIKEGDTHWLELGIPQGIQGPPGPSSNGGSISLGKGYVDYRDYSVGSGNDDDGALMTQAWNSLRGTGGKIVVRPPDNFYNYKTTFQAIPEGSQAWVDIDWVNTLYNKSKYTGPSGKAAIRIAGLKSADWRGLHLVAENGRSGVPLVDVVTTSAATSSTNVTFRNFRLYLGDGQDNIGVRTGAENGGNGDISHYCYFTCQVYGGGALRGQGSPIVGQYGFQNLGHNTLANSWYNCFVDRSDRFYCNISRNEQLRGNAAAFFYGCGGAHNGDEFVTGWEGPMGIFGGRWENGHRAFYIVRPVGGYQEITIHGPVLKDYNAPSGLVQLHQACSFEWKNVYCTRKTNDKYVDPFRLLSNNGVGKLELSGGGLFADVSRKPYVRTGTTQWNVTMDSVASLGDKSADVGNGNLYSKAMWPDENQALLSARDLFEEMRDQFFMLKRDYEALRERYEQEHPTPHE